MAHEGSRQERQARDRGVTRSKAEKTRPPTVPVPQVDIVPGRLNEAEWLALLALEEGEDVVGDLVDELLTRVLDSAFSVYLTRQCVPFTINQAREAMLQITEWRFLARDEGEAAVAEDPTWAEDEEPSACTTDAWAQGSVPVLRAPASPGREETPQSEHAGSTDRSPSARLGAGSRARERPPEPEPEPAARPDPRPSPDAEPGGTSEAQEDGAEALASSGGSPGASAQRPADPSPAGGPQRPPEPSSDTGARHPAERAESLGTRFSLGDLYFCASQLEGPGDRPAPRREAAPGGAADESESRPSAASTGEPSPCAAFWAPRPPPADSQPGWPLRRRGPKGAMARLDPARLPRHWVRPRTEILVQDLELCPLEAYRERPRSHKTGIPAEPQDLSTQVSPKASAPLLPGLSLYSLQGGTPLELTSASLDPQSPVLEAKSPLSPGDALRFHRRHPVLPDKAHSPKLWPGAKWPTGLEGEAELLDELWAGRSRIPALGQEGPDPHTWPHPAILEATSQVQWNRILLPETVKLVPGVRMWDPATRVLLNSAESEPQLEDREGSASVPLEQHPIQTLAPKPEMTVAQITGYAAAPEGWSVFPKLLPHSEP